MRSRAFARCSIVLGALLVGQACLDGNAAPGDPSAADPSGSDVALSDAADSGKRGDGPRPGDIVVDTNADADAGVVLDCVKGAVSAVHVEFECSTVTVYTCKDLSNLVIEFEDGTRQRFEGQKGHTNTFAGTGSFAGKRVARVWVKAGANHSGDGPGYGERVETTVTGDCDQPRAGSGGAGGEGCIEGPDVSCVPQPTSGIGGPGAGAGGTGGDGPA